VPSPLSTKRGDGDGCATHAPHVPPSHVSTPAVDPGIAGHAVELPSTNATWHRKPTAGQRQEHRAQAENKPQTPPS
jgi:hypothetical protein